MTIFRKNTECKTYSSNAHVFKRAYQGLAGYDLFAAETKVLKPRGRALIKLDLSMAIPEGYCGRIVEHSGLENMCGIIVHDGTIDSDYRGVVCVILFNLSDEEYLVELGNCIAQLINERCFTPKFVKVSKFMEQIMERGGKVLVPQVFDMSCEQ